MKNNRVRVPRDVDALIKKKRALRISACCIIELILLFVAVKYREGIFGGTHPGLSYVFFAVLLILPVYFLKIPFWLFDKTWAGEIVSKEEETYNAFEKGYARSMRWQTNKLQRLNVKLDTGRIIEYVIYDNIARHAFRKTTYNVGDRVIHVGGTRYLQAAPINDEDTLICVICGAESRATASECPVCGKTLKID